MFHGFGFQGQGLLRVDPRTKMLLVILFSFAAMREPRRLYQAILFLVAYLLLINGKQFLYAQKMLGVFAVMYAVDFFVLKRCSANGLTVLLAGIMIFRQFLPVIMVFVLMIRTTKVSEFLAAFDKMHIPQSITIPFSVMFRFFPTIGEEWDNIRNALRLRGFSLTLKNLVSRPAFVYECAIVPLLSDTVIIADELSAASLCRGLGADCRRTCLAEVKMGIFDYILIGVALWLNIASMFAY